MRWITLRVRSELRTSVLWACALALAIAVAAGSATFMVAGAARTSSAPDRYADSRGTVHDVAIEQSNGSPIDLTELRSVDAADSATFVFGGLVAGTEVPADVGTALVPSLLFAGSPNALGDALVEGRHPEVEGELVATRSFQEAVGAELGDRFVIVTISPELAAGVGFDVEGPDGPMIHATLVGITDGPNDFQDGFPVAIMPPQLLAQGDIGIAATVSVASLSAGATIADVRDELAALPGDVAFGVERANWVPTVVRDAVAARATALWIVALLLVVTTVVVLGQLATRQVRPAAETRRALASIGLTGRQIALERVALAAPALVVGVVGATLIAYGMSDRFPLGFVSRVDPVTGRWWNSIVHLLVPIGIGVAVGLWIMLSMLAGARRTDARRVVTADRTRWSMAKIRPLAAAVAVRIGFSRSGAESRAGPIAVGGLVVVLALLIGALTFGWNVTRLVDRPDRFGIAFDAGAGAGGDALPSHVVDVLVDDSDVTAVAVYRTVLVRVGDEALDVTGSEAVTGDLAADVLDGRLPTAPDEIAVGRNAAEDLGVGIGDPLSLDGPAGTTEFTVTGLVVVPPVEGNDGVGEGALATLEGVQRLDPDGAPTFVGFDLVGGADPEMFDELAERTGMGVGPIDRPVSILNVARTTSAPLLLAAVLGLLGVLSLAHFLLVSNRRRRRDMAILRALGADRHWISAVIHWQASLLTLATLVVAVPAGVIVGSTLSRWFVDRIGAAPETQIPIAWIVLTTVGTLVIGNGLALVAATAAARHDPADVLRSR